MDTRVVSVNSQFGKGQTCKTKAICTREGRSRLNEVSVKHDGPKVTEQRCRKKVDLVTLFPRRITIKTGTL